MGKDGVTPLSLAEWIDLQVSDAPHLFESNASGGNRSVKNPFRKESWNLTEQMRLQKSDPSLAWGSPRLISPGSVPTALFDSQLLAYNSGLDCTVCATGHEARSSLA